ncbi:MAG: hypothetical protein AABZ06_04610 [Bdellovibrionota bacterium]
MAKKIVTTTLAVVILATFVAIIAKQRSGKTYIDSSPNARAPKASFAEKSVLAAKIPVKIPAHVVAKSLLNWDQLNSGVKKLDSTDQAGLDLLYKRAKSLIEDNETLALATFSIRVPELNGLSFEESFFVVSAMIRYSHAPVSVLQAIWRYTPPAEEQPKDYHHVELTTAVKYERIEAYALKEILVRIERDPHSLNPSDRAALVAELTKRARYERSLNLSLEMFQILAYLQENDAISTALAGHSERDQKLIRSVIDSGEHSMSLIE